MMISPETYYEEYLQGKSKSANRENGIMWICYSAVFWISTIMGIRSVSIAGIVLAAGCLGGLPLLVIAYNRIYRKYKR